MKSDNKKVITTQKIDFKDGDFKIHVHQHASEFAEKAFHEEIEIKYYYEGRSALTVGSDVILAQPGDITVANPYEVHSNILTGEYSGKYCVIIIDLDFLSSTGREGLDLRRILIEKGIKFVNHIKGDERIVAILKRIAEEVTERKEHYKTVVRSLVTEFFALMLRGYVNETDTESKPSSDVKKVKLIAPALSMIHLSYSKRLSVEELADACSVSKYHFCRVFKQVTNLTVVQYITSYRVDVAEVMLKSGADSIKDVAWQCGFDDESYFYRCYKKLKGVVPGKVKKSKYVK